MGDLSGLKLTKIFTSKNSLKGATSFLALTLLVSNILGLLRNVVLASRFSPEELDIYFAAFQIPNLIFNLLVFGAISTAFIPIFSELIVDKKDTEGWRLTANLFNLVTLLLISLSIILGIFMPKLILIVVPGFDSTRLGETIILSRIMFLQAIIFGWSYIMGGVLNTYKRFFAYSLAPILYNISIIIGAFLSPFYGIRGLAWSVVFGALLHFLIQFIPAYKLGFRFLPILSWRNMEIKKIFKLMIPRNLSLGITQLNLLIFTALASSMSLGSIAVLNLTNDFQTAPVVIFANSLAVALFPTLTQLASQKQWPEFIQVLNKSIKVSLFFLIPSALIMLVLRAQIMRLYVGLGKSFDWEATTMAINTLAFFAIGIVPSGLVAIFSRVFYALKNTKLPMYLSAISVLVGIFFAYIFQSMGVSGLALAFSLSSLINAILLLIIYQRKFKHNLNFPQIFSTALYSLIGSILMSGLVWFTLQLVDAIYHFDGIPTSTHDVLGLTIQTVIALVVGVVFYLMFTYIFMREDLMILFQKKDKDD